MGRVAALAPLAAERAAAVFADGVLFLDHGIVEPPPITRFDLKHFHGSSPVIRSGTPASHGGTQLLRLSRSARQTVASDDPRGSDDSALFPARDGIDLGCPDPLPHLVRDRG